MRLLMTRLKSNLETMITMMIDGGDDDDDGGDDDGDDDDNGDQIWEKQMSDELSAWARGIADSRTLLSV